MRQDYNFIDLFSGAGGMSCGLEMAGWKCLLGVDHNKDALKTFAANHKHATVWLDDIKKLTKPRLNSLLEGKPVHAVVGGPPCQGFSTVGNGDPKDKRNSLFLQFVRIVKATNPEFLIVENVTGLLATKNEATLKAIFREFEKLGYHLNVKVLSSHHYGVPEKRRRTIIIGSRLPVELTFPKPTVSEAITVGTAFADLKTKKGDILNHDTESAQIKNDIDRKRIKHIPEGSGIRYQKDEKVLPPRLRLGVDWENLPEGRFRQTKYQRLDRNLPSPTIMTHRHGYFHPTESRYLTVREAAKIQSFPNDFEFHGTVTSQWRQIGNAVPPLMAKAIGKQINKLRKSFIRNKLKVTKKVQNKHYIKERSGAFSYHNEAS